MGFWSRFHILTCLLVLLSFFSLSSDAYVELDISTEKIYMGDDSEIVLDVKGKETDVEQSVPADIVLVMDTSGSMLYDMSGSTREDLSSDERRIGIAIETAKEFVDLVSENSANRVSIATLTHEGDTKLGLTSVTSSNTIKNAIDSLVVCGGTNYYLALVEARRILDEGGRPDAQKVIVFLSDGRPTTSNRATPYETQPCPFSIDYGAEETFDGDPSQCTGVYYRDIDENSCSGGSTEDHDIEAGIAGANLVKDSGMQIFTIGLGTQGEIDSSLLTQMASHPDYFFFAGSQNAMSSIYDTISEKIISTIANDVVVSLELPADVDFEGTHFESSSESKEITFSQTDSLLSWNIGSLSKQEKATLSFYVTPSSEGVYPFGGESAYAEYVTPLDETERELFPIENLEVLAPAPEIKSIKVFDTPTCSQVLPLEAPISTDGCLEVVIEDDNLDLDNVFADISSISTGNTDVKGECEQTSFAKRPYSYECEFSNVAIDVPVGGSYPIEVKATDISQKSDTKSENIVFTDDECDVNLTFKMIGTPGLTVDITATDEFDDVIGEKRVTRSRGSPTIEKMEFDSIPATGDVFLSFVGNGPYPAAGNPLHVIFNGGMIANLVFNVAKNSYVFSLSELTGEENICKYNEACISSPEICDGNDNDCNGHIDEIVLPDGTAIEGALCGECVVGEQESCDLSVFGICGDGVKICEPDPMTSIPTWSDCKLVEGSDENCVFPDIKSVRPILECVEYDEAAGDYVAHFGYLNENNESVDIPVGDDNRFSPEPTGRGQPETFTSGRSSYYPNSAFSVRFDGSNLVWTLEGPDGSRRTSTASSDSRECPSSIPDGPAVCDPGDRRPCECHCDETTVLLIRDDNHHNEDITDLDVILDDLEDMGVNVVFKREEDFSSNGIVYDDIKEYDLVWFSNPGWPPDDEGSMNALKEYFEKGNPVIIQGDDMTWSMGNEFNTLMEELTGLRYVSNGNDQNHQVTFASFEHPLLRNLRGRTFTYLGNDIDVSTLTGSPSEYTVLASAESNVGNWMSKYSQQSPVPTITLRDRRAYGHGVIVTALLTLKGIDPVEQRKEFTANMVNYLMNMVEKCVCDIPEPPYCEIAIQECTPDGTWGTCDVLPELSGQGCINCLCDKDSYSPGEEYSCNIYDHDDNVIETVSGNSPDVPDSYLFSHDVDYDGTIYPDIQCSIIVNETVPDEEEEDSASCDDIEINYALSAEESPVDMNGVVAYYIPETGDHIKLASPVPLEFSQTEQFLPVVVDFDVRRVTQDQEVFMDSPEISGCSIDGNESLFNSIFKKPNSDNILLSCDEFLTDQDSCFDAQWLMKGNSLTLEPRNDVDSAEIVGSLGGETLELSCDMVFRTNLDSEETIENCGDCVQRLSFSAFVEDSSCDMRYCLIKEELNHDFWMTEKMEIWVTDATDVIDLLSSICGIVPTVSSMMQNIGTTLTTISVTLGSSVGKILPGSQVAWCGMQKVGGALYRAGSTVMESVWRGRILGKDQSLFTGDSAFSLEFICDLLVNCNRNFNFMEGYQNAVDSVFNSEWSPLSGNFLGGEDFLNQMGHSAQEGIGSISLRSCDSNEDCSDFRYCASDGKCRPIDERPDQSQDLFSASISSDNIVYNAFTLCLPGVIRNLNTYRQMHCTYVQCLMSHETTADCLRSRNDVFCRKAVGPIFELLGPLRLLRAIKQSLLNLFENLPSLVVQGVWRWGCDVQQNELWLAENVADEASGCLVPEYKMGFLFACQVPKTIFDSIDTVENVRMLVESVRNFFETEDVIGDSFGNDVCSNVKSFEGELDDLLEDCECGPSSTSSFWNHVYLESADT